MCRVVGNQGMKIRFFLKEIFCGARLVKQQAQTAAATDDDGDADLLD